MDCCAAMVKTIPDHIARVIQALGLDSKQCEQLAPYRDPAGETLAELLSTASMVGLVESRNQLAVRRMLIAAVRHGELRRMQGVSAAKLLEEVYRARQQISELLRAGYAPGVDPLPDALARFDDALALAGRASLLGHHRLALEERGQWLAALDQLGEPGDDGSSGDYLRGVVPAPSAR